MDDTIVTNRGVFATKPDDCRRARCATFGNMVKTRIRPATNADIEAVTALVFGVLPEYGLSGDPLGIDADLEDIEANYSARGGCFDVVTNAEGEIEGTVGLYPLGNGVCELRKMYLVKSARGKGIGRALLEHALGRARELGFRRIELETNSRLVEAISLYRRNGFQPIENTHHAERCDKRLALDLSD